MNAEQHGLLGRAEIHQFQPDSVWIVHIELPFAVLAHLRVPVVGHRRQAIAVLSVL